MPLFGISSLDDVTDFIGDVLKGAGVESVTLSGEGVAIKEAEKPLTFTGAVDRAVDNPVGTAVGIALLGVIAFMLIKRL